MKTVGIICEYDPFHNGHRYMIDTLREAGARRIICLMSGSTVQRGEAAILPAEYRSRAALACGADAVFELPYPWCSAGAEAFAAAGIYILWKLGADTVAFGSESADLSLLTAAAERAADFKARPERTRRDGTGTAKEYFDALGMSDLSPNDILGVEYVKAARLLGAELNFFPIRRIGAGHGSDESSAYPSASALRREIGQGSVPSGMPVPMCEELALAIANGDCPILSENLSGATLAYWRLTDPSVSGDFAECGGGVAGRLHSASLRAGTSEEMFRLAATKKYTASRLRRAALFAMTGVHPDDIRALPSYVRLLGAGDEGRAFLAEGRRTREIPVVTKPSRIPEGERAQRQTALGDAAEALMTLARPTPCAARVYLKGAKTK